MGLVWSRLILHKFNSGSSSGSPIRVANVVSVEFVRWLKVQIDPILIGNDITADLEGEIPCLTILIPNEARRQGLQGHEGFGFGH